MSHRPWNTGKPIKSKLKIKSEDKMNKGEDLLADAEVLIGFRFLRAKRFLQAKQRLEDLGFDKKFVDLLEDLEASINTDIYEALKIFLNDQGRFKEDKNGK
jgi:hypothetical protein